ncbi:MAG: NUDIX domain-containing protein [Clostridia bacterium]|nr:NUDIX domain-containing protein [Clostridia bacterium]
MKQLNVIIVYHPDGEHVLMCMRRKPPYQDKYNLVGGKVEQGEDGMTAAYRELREETGITDNDVTLTHVMDFRYAYCRIELQVYAGALKRDVCLVEETNPLCWMPLTENFFDPERFAGEGNIGHMLESVRVNIPQIMHA